MEKYTFVKDYNYTSYGIAPIPHTIKKGESFNGVETANGIVIALNGGNPSDYLKEVAMPDMPSSFLTVPNEYLTQSFIQQHKNHLLIAGALVLGYFAYKKFNK
jgi:hypothetical protein